MTYEEFTSTKPVPKPITIYFGRDGRTLFGEEEKLIDFPELKDDDDHMWKMSIGYED